MTKFTLKTIALIATSLRQYKKLFVTTEGQMFQNELDADEAVRTKNLILDDPNDYVGIIVMSEEMVSDAQLRKFASDPDTFNELFEKARIPKSREAQKQEHQRSKEKRVDTSNIQIGVEELLGVNKKEEKEEKEEEEEAVTPQQPVVQPAVKPVTAVKFGK